MYISVFGGGQGRREIIFRIWKQKPLRVIAGKLMVRNAVNLGVVHSSKNKFFWDVLLDLVGINFRICGISIVPGHRGDVFDVGNVLLERSPEAAISREVAAGALVAIV